MSVKLCLTALTAALLATAIACDPGHGITYENRTGQAITVFEDGVANFTMAQFETKTFSEFKFSGTRTFEAKSQDGTVIYAETLTWDEFEDRGWRIVITESAQLTPTPTVPPG